MKTILLPALCLVLFFSCKPSYKDNAEKMKGIVEKRIQDETLKENIKLNLIELKFLRYDTINDNQLDSFRLLLCNVKVMNIINHSDVFSNEKERLAMDAKLKESIKDYSSAASKFNEESKKFFLGSYLDSIAKYYSLDSAIRNRITLRKTQNTYYESKFFYKAIYEKDGEKENYVDTLYYHFTPDLKLVKVKIE